MFEGMHRQSVARGRRPHGGAAGPPPAAMGWSPMAAKH